MSSLQILSNVYKQDSAIDFYGDNMINARILTVTIAVLFNNPILAMESLECGHDKALPLTAVADVDANGVVNAKDIAMLAKHIGNNKDYYALYDRNADGKLDDEDVTLATRDMKKKSSVSDQQITAMYLRFKNIQTVRGYDELDALGYVPIPVPLKGHGVHWFNGSGLASMMGLKTPDPYIAEGLNVSTDEKRVHALFWASPASPVFDNGATDYPDGESWKDARVISFDNMPVHLTSRHNEMWHKHGGLCMPLSYEYDELGNRSITGEAHQHTTYNECQAMPGDLSMMPDGSNMWVNFWMVHVWLNDLNPNGLFDGHHPCVERNAPDDEIINGDREVPEFFRHHVQMMH